MTTATLERGIQLADPIETGSRKLTPAQLGRLFFELPELPTVIPDSILKLTADMEPPAPLYDGVLSDSVREKVQRDLPRTIPMTVLFMDGGEANDTPEVTETLGNTGPEFSNTEPTQPASNLGDAPPANTLLEFSDQEITAPVATPKHSKLVRDPFDTFVGLTDRLYRLTPQELRNEELENPLGIPSGYRARRKARARGSRAERKSPAFDTF